MVSVPMDVLAAMVWMAVLAIACSAGFGYVLAVVSWPSVRVWIWRAIQASRRTRGRESKAGR